MKLLQRLHIEAQFNKGFNKSVERMAIGRWIASFYNQSLKCFFSRLACVITSLRMKPLLCI